MDMDDEDDFYAPDEPATHPTATDSTGTGTAAANVRNDDDELESGEEEDEGAAAMDEDNGDSDSESDIDIITERKDGSQPAPPTQSRYSDIRNIPQRTASSDPSTKAAAPAAKDPISTRSQAQPALSTSKIDVHAVPVYKPTGKPITQVNIDIDLQDNDKPWRKPGTDISDYFNYGFDEFTWTMYAAKQDSVRGEFSQDAVAQNNKKMMEDMQMMMMGGMPGMGGPGGPGGPGAGPGGAGGGPGMPGMPGMEGMPPEMQQMMQQMMASGMDPSQMDPGQMFAAMQQGAGAGQQGGQGGQGQNFGGVQGFGGGQGQGYDNFNQGMGGGGGRGGFGSGRGRRGRGGW